MYMYICDFILGSGSQDDKELSSYVNVTRFAVSTKGKSNWIQH